MRTPIVAGLAVALLGLGAPSSSVAEPPGRDVSLEAVVDLRPSAGQTARGLVRLTADPNGGTQARGVLVALLLPAVQAVRVVLVPKSCADVVVSPVHLDLLGVAVDTSSMRSAGTAEVSADGTFAARDLRRAKAVAIAGDWDGDGEDEVAACGEVEPHGVAWDAARSDRNLFVSAETLGADPFGGAPFVAYGRVQPDGDGRLRAVSSGLRPDSAHALGASRVLCVDVWEHAVFAPEKELARFTTDEHGSAATHPGGVNVLLADGSVRFARSLVVTRPTEAGQEVVACASLRRGTVVGDRG